MSPTYAAGTSVGADRSRDEIERTLHKWGADQFMYGQQREPARAIVAFSHRGRQIKFTIDMPDREDPAFTTIPTTGKRRSESAAFNNYEQAVKERWRALALVIKAKLVAVDSGVVTFEQEFLPYMVLPGGATVAETVLPGIEQAYLTGDVSPLLQIGS